MEGSYAMKSAHFDHPKDFVKNYPKTTRAVLILLLPVSPLFIAGLLLWQERDDFVRSMCTHIEVALKPWEFH